MLPVATIRPSKLKPIADHRTLRSDGFPTGRMVSASHSRTVPEGQGGDLVPFGAVGHGRSGSGGRRGVRRRVRVAASQSRTVSTEPVDTSRSSSTGNRARTSGSSTRSGSPMGCPVAASHDRTVLSVLPEAIRRPSSRELGKGTAPSWPSMGCQLAASHTRTVLSSPPDTTRRLSGLNATFPPPPGARAGRRSRPVARPTTGSSCRRCPRRCGARRG